MSEISRISDQLHRAFHGEAWHGPALMEVLEDVNASTAAAHPVASAHSIWELVYHVTTWKGVVVRRLAGEAVEPTPDENFPPVTDASEDAWQRSLTGLKQAQQQFERTVSALPDSRLADPVPGRPYNVYVMLHGFIQHDIYHAGQIALLKKTQ